jgi:hypothetical protein
MKRRTTLKRLALVTGGVILIPSCKPETEKLKLEAFTNLDISNQDQEMMSQLCEIIIPSDGSIKGATDLGLASFVLIMANDCLSPEQQNDFLKGWQNFKSFSIKNGINPLKDSNNEVWKEIVLEYYRQEEKREELASSRREMEGIGYFFNTVKRFTILGYIKSEYYMTKIMSYNMMPGKFKGNIPINENEKVNLYG